MSMMPQIEEARKEEVELRQKLHDSEDPEGIAKFWDARIQKDAKVRELGTFKEQYDLIIMHWLPDSHRKVEEYGNRLGLIGGNSGGYWPGQVEYLQKAHGLVIRGSGYTDHS